MAIRVRFPTASARGRVAGRQFSASSHVLASSRIGSTPRPSRPRGSTAPDNNSSPELQGPAEDPRIPETPTSRVFSQQATTISIRRPAVKPPPTLALPLSMYPPSPRASPPTSLVRKEAESGQQISKRQETSYDIYLNSIAQAHTEPTLEDLDALRPPPSAIRAAFEGVLGSGRSMLPEGHSLYLDVEQLGVLEASVGGGPGAKKTVFAGSNKAKKLEYTALYAATEGKIAHHFTLVQLRRLEKESIIEKGGATSALKKSVTKQNVIHRIMNSRWGMIHPVMLQKSIAAKNEISERVYPVSPSELFIFLGRDGENLLHLAEELQMRISVDREPSEKSSDAKEPLMLETSNPRPRFIIRASGRAENHKQLMKHLEEQRLLMNLRIVVLPTGPMLSPALLQHISRTAGAYVENSDLELAKLKETKNSAASVLITARDPRSAYTAERLVQRAALEDVHRSHHPLFFLAKSGETSLDATEISSSREHDEKYALYPFDSHGFRIRRVQYTRHSPTDDPIHLLYPLGPKGDERVVSSAEALILTGREHPSAESSVDENMVTTTLKGETVDLFKHISEEAGELVGGQNRKITATFGYVVFKATHPTALIPLVDPGPRTSVLEWAEKQETKARSFVPSQVPPITRSMPDKIISVHRLQYRTIEGRNIINIDVDLPNEEVEPPAARSQGDTILDPEGIDPDDRLELTPENQEGTERAVSSIIGDQAFAHEHEDKTKSQDRPSSSNLAEAHSDQPVESTESVEAADWVGQEPTSLPTEITIGTETTFELTMPDCTMDMCVQVSDVSSMAKATIPETLETYLKALSEFFTTDIDIPQPDPPQTLLVDEKHYMLVKNTSSRYGVESSFTDLPSGCIVASEIALDLENNSRTAFTQLAYNGTGGAEGWERFMRACHSLAGKPYEQSTKLRVNPT